MADAVVRLIHTLPNHVQRSVMEQLSSPLAALLERHAVATWNGMACFSLRVLRLIDGGALGPTDDVIVHHVHLVYQWWVVHGRPHGRIQLRDPCRLTANLPLLYTSLSAHHPLHHEARGFCVQQPPHNSANDVWRTFIRCFPVLSMYRSVWNAEEAQRLLGVFHGSLTAGSLAEVAPRWGIDDGCLDVVLPVVRTAHHSLRS